MSTDPTAELWTKLVEHPEYRKLLDQLPQDERKAVEKQLRELTEDFMTQVLLPIRTLTNK
jgi:mRNA-degrading endonuclease RelE of RelBE toxin-antitoxin system